jgi:hypothetical protein
MDAPGGLTAPTKPVTSPPHARGGGGGGAGATPGGAAAAAAAAQRARSTPTVAVPTLNLSRASSAVVDGDGSSGTAGLDMLIPVINKLQVGGRRRANLVRCVARGTRSCFAFFVFPPWGLARGATSVCGARALWRLVCVSAPLRSAYSECMGRGWGSDDCAYLHRLPPDHRGIVA